MQQPNPGFPNASLLHCYRIDRVLVLFKLRTLVVWASILVASVLCLQLRSCSKNRGGAKRHNQELFRGPDTNGCKWTACAHYRTTWRHPTYNDQGVISSNTPPTPVIQKVHPGNSLLGVVRPISDKVFVSKCSVDHLHIGDTQPGAGVSMLARFRQRLPSLSSTTTSLASDGYEDAEDEGDVYAFSFGLYLAQTCRMLIVVPPTNSGPGTNQYYRKNVMGSGVVRECSTHIFYSARDRFRA